MKTTHIYGKLQWLREEEPEMKTDGKHIKLYIRGMTCVNCQIRIQKQLKQIFKT